MESAGFLTSLGNSVAWGTPELAFRGFAPGERGYQVDRERFDALLLEGARSAGARVPSGVRAAEVVSSPGGGQRWRIRWEGTRGHAGELRASWVLDATGRVGLMARQGFRRRHEGPASTAILTVWHRPGGWVEDTGGQTVVEVEEAENALRLPEARGEIRMEEVTFTFGRGEGILDGVDLHLHPGETVAVVGASGSGKSTMADLLVRHLDPDGGRILLDGHDIRTLRLPDLRRHVVAVDQEPFLFHATLAENVLYARPDAPPEEVDRVIREAGLGALLDSLPDGLDTVVGERGRSLSVGERQRLALARALLCDPAVLVLDEPTAALDPASEEEVMRSYGSATRSRTTLLITHRATVAGGADRGGGAGRRAHRPGRPPRAPCHDPRPLPPTLPAGVHAGGGDRDSIMSSGREEHADQRGLLRGDHPLLRGRTGRGVAVAVLDSGVNPSHPHVGGIASARALAGHPDPVDVLGHGTAVAAAIHEKAPDAEIHVLKVFHGTLSSTIPTLLEAMDLASEGGGRLVNLSLGTWKEEHAPLLEEAVRRARDRGSLVVSALERDGITWYPGALEGVIPVVMDPLCPRDGIRMEPWGDGFRIRASGFPRPIPGVPPERNLNGVSFAVANATGVLARLLEGHPHVVDLPALRDLMQEGESTSLWTPLPFR